MHSIFSHIDSEYGKTASNARRGESGIRGVLERTTRMTQRLRNDADEVVLHTSLPRQYFVDAALHVELAFVDAVVLAVEDLAE